MTLKKSINCSYYPVIIVYLGSANFVKCDENISLKEASKNQILPSVFKGNNKHQ